MSSSQVIDLTEEGGEALHSYHGSNNGNSNTQSMHNNHHHHGPNQPPPPRPIDLTDESDEIEYIGQTRLHLPARAHATGNDPTPDFRNSGNGAAGPSSIQATLRQHVRDAQHRDRHVIFSRGAGSLTHGVPARAGVYRSGSAAQAGPGPAAEAHYLRQQHNVTGTNNNNDSSGGAGVEWFRDGRVPPAGPARGGHAVRRNTGFQGILNDPAEYGLPQAAQYGVVAAGRVMNVVGNLLQNIVGFGDWGADDPHAEAHYQHQHGGRYPAAHGPGAGAVARFYGGYNPNMRYNPGSAVPMADENKRKRKSYHVGQSHPIKQFNKKKHGKYFSRDVIPPPDYEPEGEEEDPLSDTRISENRVQENTQPSVSNGKAKGKGKAKAKVEEIDVPDKEDMAAAGPSSRPAKTRKPNSTRVMGSDESDFDATEEEDVPLVKQLKKDRPTLTVPSATSPGWKGKGKGRATDIDVPPLDIGDSISSASSSATAFSSMPMSTTDNTSSASSSSTSIELIPSIAKPSTLPTKQPSPSVELEVPPPSPLPSKPKTRLVPAPICASCAEPLYLNQPSKHRPYLLLCSHVVCHACLVAAQDRVREWAAKKKEGGWTGTPAEIFEEIDGGGGGKDNEVPYAATSQGKRNAKAKVIGKRKRKRDVDQDDDGDDTESTFDEQALVSSTKKRKVDSSSKSQATTRGTRSRRAAAAVASARDFAESSGDEDIQVPEDSTYHPDSAAAEVVDTPGSSEKEGQAPRQEGDLDDEMNDKPRQPAASVTTKNARGKGKTSIAANASINRGKVRKEAAGKGNKVPRIDAGPEINMKWLDCPVVDCQGHKTELLDPIGSQKGAWEMFV